FVLERHRIAERPPVGDVLTGFATVGVLAGITAFLAARLNPAPMLVVLAVVGGATLLLGLVMRPWGGGPLAVGLVVLAIGATLAVVRTAAALFIPLSWWSEPWSLERTAIARDHLSPTDPATFSDWWWAALAAVVVLATGLVATRLGPRLIR